MNEIIKEYNKFLSVDECNDIIVNGDTSILVERLSAMLQIDSAYFETVEISRFKKGESLSKHIDYFVGAGLDSQCAYGGNRRITAVVYLNDIILGGETNFPWLRRFIKPESGKLAVIDYSSNVAREKILSEHEELPTITGEKIIATVYIREYPVAEKISHRVRNLHYRAMPEDTTFNIECGPETDRRTLEVTLPGNTDPSNTIMVGVTAGIDSSLLLYLVAGLNSMQSIPYYIQPVVIDNRLGSSDDPQNKFSNPIIESWLKIPKMIELIREKIPGSNILDFVKISADPGLKRVDQIESAMIHLFKKPNRFFNYKHIYQAITENPPELPGGPFRPSEGGVWKLPLAKMQKTHIVDTLLQLDLEEIIEISSKCSFNHSSLTEHCSFLWQCNERRWAFDKLGRQDLGEKYFLNVILNNR